jgi:hypothetical protein
MTDITPGSKVTIKIIKQPTAVAASKTLVRVLCKDPIVHAENQRQRKVRKTNYSPARRGGRLYGGRVVKQHAVTGKLGEAGTIIATADVIRDLTSVARFIEVTAA